MSTVAIMNIMIKLTTAIILCIVLCIEDNTLCNFVQNLFKKGVLFVNYPNKIWNRATFLTEYSLVSV